MHNSQFSILIRGEAAARVGAVLSDENWALGIEHWSDPGLIQSGKYCQAIFARILSNVERTGVNAATRMEMIVRTITISINVKPRLQTGRIRMRLYSHSLVGESGTASTGQDDPRMTRSAVVPRSVRSSMLFPCVPMTIIPAFSRPANARRT